MPVPVIVRIAIAGCALLSIGSPASAQQPATTPPQSDVLQQLLSEVRQLRLSVEHAATESAALQLLAMRAAMQEERLYRISREVDTLRTDLEAARRDAATLATNMKEFERTITDETDQNRRLALEGELPAMRARLQAAREKEQFLVQQEGNRSGSLATEEGRWQDINARLDDLERRVTTRVQRP